MNDVRNSFILSFFSNSLNSPNPKRSFDHTVNPQKLTHGFLWATETMQRQVWELWVGFVGAGRKKAAKKTL
jgi:hypothetical protein